MEGHTRHLAWLVGVGVLAIVLAGGAASCSSLGRQAADAHDHFVPVQQPTAAARATSVPVAVVTPARSSAEVYGAIIDQGVCMGVNESLFAPAWDGEKQVWSAPCVADDDADSRCILVTDDTLEILSKKLEDSICRQGP